jgi:predicted TIM-barrel fold metal-dependent hydrolase
MEDLRRGKLEITPYYFKVDMPFFQKELKDFLPSQIIDIHAHTVDPGALKPDAPPPDSWAERVCPNGMDLPSLLESYVLMFPGKHIKPVIFGWPSKRFDFEKQNVYVADQARKFCLPSLILTKPSWSATELERRVKEGGFIGLKPYPIMVEGKPQNDVEIFDFLPRSHLELADEKRWLIILHIPRPGRIDDPVNIRQLLYIDEHYPHAKIVVAHVGRAYCPGQGERALQVLQDTQNLIFDISANTNQLIFQRLIETVGCERIVFGSDMPITAMHAKRICEGYNYVNIILNADWKDAHTRSATPEDQVTFFLYEEIYAFKKAAEKEGLSRKEIEKIFFWNAQKILEIR